MASEHYSVGIIGAGPAGLTAAYLLAKQRIPVLVIEADPVHVGGISRTPTYKGYRFDIGGHRFFSKSKEIEEFWDEILPGDFLDRRRSSHILYRGQFYSYPLKAMEAFQKMGPIESLLCLLSYVKARLFPVRDPKTVEEWVCNRFGRRLYRIFFKAYTEKVWGMKCGEISADWASQRIQGLSLWTAGVNAVLKPLARTRGGPIKTLVDSFRYPRKGPGMLWTACAAKVRAMGGAVELGLTARGFSWDAKTRTWTISLREAAGGDRLVETEHLISSAPIPDLVRGLKPGLSPAGVRAAESLRYRDLIVVMVIMEDRNRLQDHWVYINDPNVKVGRIANFKLWSPEMVPDPGMACYGLEYFCFEGDALWALPDTGLLELAGKEMEALGLCSAGDIVDGCVERQKKAYPVYDEDYRENIEIVRRELEERFQTLHLVGRNGMHKYNNQDHAMMTAMLTVENITQGRRVFDVWAVNQDAAYHEADLK